MPRSLKPGSKVTWKSHGGEAEGHVVKKLTKRTHIKGHTVAATPDEPQYLVESETGAGRAAHKAGALKKR